MTEFTAFNRDIEVNGETVLSFIEGTSSSSDSKYRKLLKNYEGMAYSILENHGIKDPRKGKWYPQQNWLDAFRDFNDSVGPWTLRLIGRSIPENANWPGKITTVKEAIRSIDTAYHMNHRLNGELLYNPDTGEKKDGIGHYGYRETEDPLTLISVCQNPYPCEFDMGIIEATAAKFSEKGAVSIKHKNEKKCRKFGVESCTYIIQLKE